MMSVDALVTKVGIKMVSTLHSSTALQGKLSLSEGKILNMELDMPQEKMEILSVKYVYAYLLLFIYFTYIFVQLTLHLQHNKQIPITK